MAADSAASGTSVAGSPPAAGSPSAAGAGAGTPAGDAVSRAAGGVREGSLEVRGEAAPRSALAYGSEGSIAR